VSIKYKNIPISLINL